MKRNGKIELLAPAGDLEKAKTAIRYGADAVYIGGQKYSLRSAASNFSLEQIEELCQFAKEHGASVHVTCNIVPHEDDIQGLDDYLLALAKAGVKAVIASSPSIISHLKKLNTGMEIHVSTQRSILNHEAANFWADQDVQRVVLGRECDLDAISSITEKCPVQTEVFIHGGMCIACSGRCVLSNYMSSRDANRGGCAQSCRWDYDLEADGQPLSQGHDPFSMSSRDLQAIPYLEALLKIGTASLKIEGRMKSSYYLAVVVGTYRRLIDLIEEKGTLSQEDLDWAREQMERAANRPSGPGFYGGLPDESVQLYASSQAPLLQEFVGSVEDVIEEKDGISTVLVQIRNHMTDQDPLEVFAPGLPCQPIELCSIESLEHEPIQVCNRPMEKVIMKWKGQAGKYGILRKRRDL